MKSLAVDPQNYYREFVATNARLRSRNPADWLRFKSIVQRELAHRRRGVASITTRDIDSIFPGILATEARVFPIPHQPYNVSWHELMLLSAITQRLQPKTVFEFGTFDGRTTVHLAANAACGARVHTIDVASGAFDFGPDSPFCEPTGVGRYLRGHALERRIDSLTGDTRTFDFTPFRGSIDLVFVDADHCEAAVLRDSAVAFDMLAKDGVVIWHDYLMIADVTKALAKLAAGRTIFHIAGTTLAITFHDDVGSIAA